MYKLKYQDMMYLKEIGLFSYGYAYLLRYLSKEEVENIKNIGNIKEEVKKVLNTLNERKSLPEEYKNMVHEYKGFSGVLIPKEEIEF